MLNYNQITSFFASYGFTLHNIAPLVVLAIVLYFLIRRDIKTAIKETTGIIKDLANRIRHLEDCIIEIQTILKAKHTRLIFQNTILKYGQSNSPIVLKNEFKKFITDPKLDKQIDNKKSKLLDWLQKQHPKTGLDAQDDIAELVTSDEISKYLDLTKFRQNLYRNGKTSEDAIGILGVYLFEVLIPKLDLPDGNESKKKS